MLESRDGYVYDLVVPPTRPRLVKFAKRLCLGDAMQADDIVQEAMLSAWNAWPRWIPRYPKDVDGSAEAWMRAIVSNKFISCTRTRHFKAMVSVGHKTSQKIPKKHFPSGGTFNTFGDALNNTEICSNNLGHTAEVVYESRQAMITKPAHDFGDEVVLALSRLPEDQRVVVMMYYQEGMTTREIGAALGISRATASTRLCRGLAKIRPMLASYALDTYGLRGPGVRVSDSEAS